MTTDEMHSSQSRMPLIAIGAAVVAIVFVAFAVVSRNRQPAPVSHVAAAAAPSSPTPTPRSNPPKPGTAPPVGAPPSNPPNRGTSAAPKPPVGNARVAPKPPIDISPRALASLYSDVGSELSRLQQVVGSADLIRRYRLIQLQSALQDPAQRAATHQLLTQIKAEALEVHGPRRQVGSKS
ncbi:MAG: hypothetical protein H0V17_16085 [Deltaproteobacteria bacterium]|nr:hypothetical protein [Deltaproteobacteria bacterium]